MVQLWCNQSLKSPKSRYKINAEILRLAAIICQLVHHQCTIRVKLGGF